MEAAAQTYEAARLAASKTLGRFFDEGVLPDLLARPERHLGGAPLIAAVARARVDYLATEAAAAAVARNDGLVGPCKRSRLRTEGLPTAAHGRGCSCDWSRLLAACLSCSCTEHARLANESQPSAINSFLDALPHASRAIAFDVGANDGGWSSKLLSRAAQRSPHVGLELTLFEPQPQFRAAAVPSSRSEMMLSAPRRGAWCSTSSTLPTTAARCARCASPRSVAPKRRRRLHSKAPEYQNAEGTF